MDDERNIEKDAKESLGSIRPLLEEVRFSISTLTTEQDVEPDRWEELLHQYSVIVNELDRVLAKMSWKFNDAVLLSREANDVANIPELLRTRRVVELEEADNIQVEQHFDLAQIKQHNQTCNNLLNFFENEAKSMRKTSTSSSSSSAPPTPSSTPPLPPTTPTPPPSTFSYPSYSSSSSSPSPAAQPEDPIVLYSPISFGYGLRGESLPGGGAGGGGTHGYDPSSSYPVHQPK